MILNFLSLRTQVHVNKIVFIENLLQNARYAIWMKNIWFTHSGLNRLLMEKIKQGLSVHIILSEDFVEEYTNYLALEEFVEAGGELFVLPAPMHQKIKNSKFILLDNEQMLYQYTNNNSMNQSGISIQKQCARHFISAYTDYFLKLERCAKNVYRF